MTSDVPSRVRALFHEALERASEARLPFLRKACGDDEALYREVAELLDLYGHIEAGETRTPVDEFIGRRVGAYQIVRLIGTGGMGRVYFGRRADGTFNRDVAIKVIDPAAVTGDLIARFEQERRLLGSLRHPCIAELFDAGRTERSELYFVMEYVDGVPITEYCDRGNRTLRGRLALFARVCDGVAEAHRHLVVHRDLKPGNILVDASGTPKIVDFGIAKPITPAGLEASDPTRPVDKRATPAYASPEQLEGGTAHTGMDVFSLGVVLHELVTGYRPVQAIARPDGTTASAGFLKPSQAVERCRETAGTSAPGREPPGLEPRQLAGDLDAVVLKALQPDVRMRYAGADSLARDVRAFLAHETVVARPASRVERLQKLGRRHPALVTASTVAVAATLTAVASLGWLWSAASRERDEVSRRFQQVRALADSTFGIDRRLAALPGAFEARQALAEAMADYLAGIPTGQDPQLDLDIAEHYRRLGDLRGNPNVPNLGDPAGATTAYESALAILEPVRAAAPGTAVTVALARTWAALGDLALAGLAFSEARTHYAAAIALADEVPAAESDTRQHLLAGLYRPLGDVSVEESDLDEALEWYQKALAIDTANVNRAPHEPEYQRLLALTLLRIADVRASAGQLEEARAGFERAGNVIAGIPAHDVAAIGLVRDAALGRARLGRVLEADGDRSGRVELEHAVGMMRSIAKADPLDARARRDLMATLVQLADVLSIEDAVLARERLLEARQIALTLLADGRDATAGTELDLIDRKLATAANATGRADLQLFRLTDQGRVLVQSGDPPLREGARVVAVGTASAGWTRYLLLLGARGPGRLLEEHEMTGQGWTIAVDGPSPSQTILLLAVPHALTGSDKQALLDIVNAIPGERVVDWESHIVWSQTGETIESQVTARGNVIPTWVETMRVRLTEANAATLAGRTFPIAPRR